MKKILTLFFATVFAVSIFAQKPLEPSQIMDNISVTVKGGVSSPLSTPFEDNSGVVGLELQKDITPTFGLGVEGEWTFPKGYDQQYVGVYTSTNIMNLLSGYKGYRRTFDMNLILGVGWGHDYIEDFADNNYVQTKTGLNFNLNLGQQKQYTISLKPAVVWNMHAPNQQANYNVNRAALQVQVGFTYHFKNSNGTHSFTFCNKVATQQEVDDLNKQINNLREQNIKDNQRQEAIIKDLTDVNKMLSEALKNCEDKKVVNEVVTPIQFEFGSYEITETSKAPLKSLAEFMKESGNDFKLTGYASEEGTKEYNQTLSENRAKAMKDALVELGVPENQIMTEGKGITTAFGEAPYNRVVVVSVK